MNRRVCRLLIAGASLSLAVFFAFKPRQTPPEIRTISVSPYTPGAPRVHRTTSPLQSEFYRTIIDNNLFRPLGWTPPRPIEPYRLIGTVLARDRNRPLQAIIETTAGNQTHIVTTGETLDTQTRVTEIQHKQVTLETNGQPRTLRLPSGF